MMFVSKDVLFYEKFFPYQYSSKESVNPFFLPVSSKDQRCRSNSLPENETIDQNIHLNPVKPTNDSRNNDILTKSPRLI